MQSCIKAVEVATEAARLEAERQRISALEAAARFKDAFDRAEKQRQVAEETERSLMNSEEMERKQMMIERGNNAAPLFLQYASQGRVRELEGLLSNEYVNVDWQDKVRRISISFQICFLYREFYYSKKINLCRMDGPPLYGPATVVS